MIVGRLILAGTGLAYHNIRKALAAEPPMPEMPVGDEACALGKGQRSFFA